MEDDRPTDWIKAESDEEKAERSPSRGLPKILVGISLPFSSSAFALLRK